MPETPLTSSSPPTARACGSTTSRAPSSRTATSPALVREGVDGVTSNPTIFQAAIARGRRLRRPAARGAQDGDRPQGGLPRARRPGHPAAPATSCGPKWDEGGSENARDGWVSLEVDPNLARDTEGTIAEAKRLHALVDRPNLFIKIPATKEGLPAIEETIAAGIPVNVTLIFSLERHREVAEAYMRGVQAARRRRRRPRRRWRPSPRSSSRASTPRPTSGSTRSAATTSSRARSRSRTRSSPTSPTRRCSRATRGRRWRAKGASAQRCLWASTSTKNPEYRDVLYVEELIGPDTVNTMPRETVEAFQDHGEVARLADRGRRRRAPHARGVRRRRDRLRRRRRDARARGRREVRQVVRAAVRRRRARSASSWRWPHERAPTTGASSASSCGSTRSASAPRPARATRRPRCRPPT